MPELSFDYPMQSYKSDLFWPDISQRDMRSDALRAGMIGFVNGSWTLALFLS